MKKEHFRPSAPGQPVSWTSHLYRLFLWQGTKEMD